MALRNLLAVGVAALAVLLIVGLAELVSTSQRPKVAAVVPPTASQVQADLAGSPPVLAELHRQANDLLQGGQRSLHARLAALRGRPIVINKWVSWCEPCEEEFGFFERASVVFGRRVAFLGIDSGQASRAEAVRFLRSHPLSYPSYYDPTEQLGTEVTDSSFQPVTVFFNRDGGEYIHQGAYPSVAKLASDIERYALSTNTHA